jgi:hypothetical protein
LLSEESNSNYDKISFLPNGNVLKESINNPTLGQKTIKYLQVNNKKWKNSVIGGDDAQVKNNTDHIWMYWRQELVIDDEKYNLDDRKGTIGNQCEVSEDGNMVAIEFDYNEYGNGQKENKSGKYILIGDRNGIQKEIKVGAGLIQKIALDNE